MKVVILAGGYGTRLAEETDLKPKPMVEIGGRPILWHIMQHYSAYGFNEFVLALGYRGEQIKRYIVDYCKLTSSLTVKLRSGDVMRHNTGRLKRLAPYLGNKTFMMTYGDGVSDVNIPELLDFHKKSKKLATLTAVRPPARFGHMSFEGENVTEFTEKPQTESGWINGGFFVLEPKVLDYIAGDETGFEHGPLEKLAAERQLAAYRHPKFWQCIDTLRDRRILEDLWNKNEAPWKTQKTM
jgi:glucose-1-phosphate cytidylyltransferase